MAIKAKELWEELRSVISGKTIDAILPPIIFVIVNALFGLDVAALTAVGLAIMLGLVRVIRGESWFYAVGGLAGVILAAGLAYLTRQAASYFIPAMISSGLLLILAVISNLVGMPLAALASHLTRGWPLDWFEREDIQPAYREVTWMWAAFFALRLSTQVYLFQLRDPGRLAWANIVLGWPFTILILLLSYIYGIWRLRNLGGPGVHEFVEEKDPPWEGQTRGF